MNCATRLARMESLVETQYCECSHADGYFVYQRTLLSEPRCALCDKQFSERDRMKGQF